MKKSFDPVASLAEMRHEFGEHGGVNMSIETSTTFTVMHAETMPEIFQGQRGPEVEAGQGGCYLYGRHFNPTVYVLGRQVAALEGAEAGYCTASGMAAIATTLLQCCNSGDHIVSADTIYGGTYAFLHDYLPKKTGIDVSFVDANHFSAVEEALTENTKVLYVETLSNPTLRVANIPRLARLAHDHGAKLVVDNTFAPMVVSPLQHGADIVIHSLTKFINGASDAIGGAICGTTEFISSLMDLHEGSVMLLGPTMDPRTAHAVSLRVPHLALRMKEHASRALELCDRLAELGVNVIYPGHASHPDHDLLKRLGNTDYGAGGVFCMDLGTIERAHDFMERLQNEQSFGYMAVSLGYFDTLMSCPGSSTSSEMPPDDQLRAGIMPGLVRIAIGYTGTVEQRWQQLVAVLRDVGMLDR